MGYHMKWNTPLGEGCIRIGSFGLADEMDEIFEMIKLKIKFNFENSYCGAEIEPETISSLSEDSWNLLKIRLPEVFVAFRSAYLSHLKGFDTAVTIT